MKKIFILTIALCIGFTICTQAQEQEQQPQESGFFKHLDASVNLGTTGVGVDVSSPMGEYFQLRGGISIMPQFHYKMNFMVQVGETNDESKFQRLSSMLESFTGYKVDNSVDMIGEPTWWNAHLLVDVFPFKRNKHWHFTAGLFLGGSQVAKAYNTTEDMPSLMAVSMYNKMYEKAILEEPLIEFGNYRWPDGDIETMDKLYYLFSGYGRMGVAVGYYTQDVYDVDGNLLHEKGKPYMMEPDDDGMVKVYVKTNSLRPYLGFGYGGRLFKGNDRYKISFDCGAMFWGGTPRIYTHDGTDLSRDVENIEYKPGTYVDLLKSFKVFPVLNLRITRTIF
jgi:hypothetical protein